MRMVPWLPSTRSIAFGWGMVTETDKISHFWSEVWTVIMIQLTLESLETLTHILLFLSECKLQESGDSSHGVSFK